MTDIPIPAEALEAVAKAAYEVDWNDPDPKWEDAIPGVKRVYYDIATAAIRAMLANWPGMKHWQGAIEINKTPPFIVLPIPQENSND